MIIGVYKEAGGWGHRYEDTVQVSHFCHAYAEAPSNDRDLERVGKVVGGSWEELTSTQSRRKKRFQC